MSDDLLMAKIHHGFDHLDADGDGLLTERDHVLMGHSVARSLGHPEGSEAEAWIVRAYLTIWHDLHLAHLPADTQAITREQFVASTRSLADDPEAAQASLGALAGAFLAVADTGKSGTVDAGEFFVFQRGHFAGLSRDDADEAFRRLDRDGDGRLSAAEFTSAIIEFWTSRDPDAPGNWWTGRPPFER
ncbi:EF-hand domain-containing protein [Kitasatospora sp. A2-31]|uniref:EF-hand domain-containing protein n=1 Tax=Kitasatospora sp. A2-31 TaxID=2916414 RepID=UPI001EECB6B3|nr:EF-hand domain-containing protein [Kitasatospora sp. A2-31]MCG6496146.1 EF-hand domain-containing protein [Kitasatospora sp. A2-31]